MKYLIFVSILFLFNFSPILSSSEPLCTESDKWEFVINNAYRVADEYAMNNYPRATFIRERKERNFKFSKQNDGKYKDEYLLTIINKRDNGTSVSVLYPLFDVNKTSNDLDDERPLWKVVGAAFNGYQYGGDYKIQDELLKENQAKIVSSGFLEEGYSYKLSKRTPVWQKNTPDFYGTLQNLPPGSIITIIGRYKEGFSTEYKIESKLPDGLPVSGWISITALSRQDLEVIEK